MQNQTHHQDVDHLNSFLRGELSALETYDQVLEKAESPSVRNDLIENRASHARRVELLSAKVRELGGEPSSDSGAWGAFARAMAGGAKVFGLSSAIGVLEEGEDHGVNDYARDLSDLSPATRGFVQSRIAPEQRATHDHLSRLKDRV